MGGLCFSLNTLWSQVFPFVALVIYSKQGEGNSTSFRLSPNELLHGLLLLSSVWFASTFFFALTIKRRYWRTFLTTSTSGQYAIQLFRESTSDESRFDAVFGNHKSYREPIKHEVKTWLAERYPIWQLERPVWFSEAAISLIPDDMLSKEALRDLVARGGGQRRRSSLGDRMSAMARRNERE